MMTRLWPVLVMAAVLGAGCTTSPASHEEGEPTDVPGRIEDPTDFSNFSESDGPHVHDYWGGRMEVDILEASFDLQSPGSTSCRPSTFPKDSCLELQPPDGLTVFPGTRWVNVTSVMTATPGAGNVVSFTAFTPNRSVEFNGNLRGAKDNLSFPSNESLNDSPHSSVSKWRFKFGVARPGLYNVTVRIQIARDAGPLPLAPPHPDHWNNATRLELARSAGSFRQVASLALAGTPPPQSFYAERIVPPFTEMVNVSFRYNSTTHVDFHYRPMLRFHGADKSREGPPIAPTSALRANANGYAVWSIVVEPRMWDSPYVDVSNWYFSLAWRAQNTGPVAAMDGDFVFDVSATRTAN